MRPKGVMGSSYASARRYSAIIKYRYHVRAQMTAKAAVQYFPSSLPLTVLDLGSADGSTVFEMSKILPALSSYVGVEYSFDLASQSTDNSHMVRMVVGDISHLPLHGQQFDLITALAVLEHLSDPLDTIKNAGKLLRKGGLFIATIPNPSWDQLSTRLKLLEDHHETHLGQKLITEKFIKAGLEVLEFKRFMLAPICFLPYLNIPVPPEFSIDFDDFVRRFRFFDWLFVNQLLVARRVD